ncbi:G-protein coupled receptor 39-like [Ambystoma mexicanum]|uniref:G-protein coupled receptor 39-like n=1 Tax=Ambystoma mexicanum TaxID=8296 RepID=UPI0037E97CBF
MANASVVQSSDLQATVRLSLEAKAAITLVYGLLFVCGVLGNTLVIRVIQKMRARCLIQASVSHHLCSLACSDLLVLLVGIPTELYSIIWAPGPWPSGTVGCKGFYALWEISSYATIFNILAFSCERYLVTCHPLRVKLMPSSRTRKLVGLVWATAVLSALPTLFTMGMEDAFLPFRQAGQVPRAPFWICTNLLAQEALFAVTILLSFALYVLVLLAVAVTCRSMMRALQRSQAGAIAVRSRSGAVQVLAKCRGTGKTCIRRQNILMLGEWPFLAASYARRLLPCYPSGPATQGQGEGHEGLPSDCFPGCIVGALAVCWVPFQARRLMMVVRSKSQWTEGYYRSYITLQPITNSFYYLSSSINPLLYNLTSLQFRRAFRRYLNPCDRPRREQSSPPSSLQQQESMDLQSLDHLKHRESV